MIIGIEQTETPPLRDQQLRCAGCQTAWTIQLPNAKDRVVEYMACSACKEPPAATPSEQPPIISTGVARGLVGAKAVTPPVKAPAAPNPLIPHVITVIISAAISLAIRFLL